MNKKSTYWVGKKPWESKRWACADSAAVLEDATLKIAVFQLYRRYVKQWNDIELNCDKDLSEHTFEICGAKVVGASRKFILHAHRGNQDHWILEVLFARGFAEYYPGLSTGRNTMRTPADIRSIRLHWSQAGEDAFENWLNTEKQQNGDNGEWQDYQA